MTAPRIRIVIADDQALVRDGLAFCLDSEEGLEVVGRAHDAESCVRVTLAEKPHVVLMDMQMPGRSVFEAAIEIASMNGDINILFMSAHATDGLIAQALDVNASGIVTKGELTARLVEAVRSAAAGKTFFSSEIESRLVFDEHGPSVASAGETPLSRLTKREREVLAYVASGMSKKDMAGTMHLSVKTIENHTSALMSKLRIHNRVELTRFAIRHGVTQP